MDEKRRQELLAEQVAYYRARAPEYDRWWFRDGRYDRGKAADERWADEVADVTAAFDRLPIDDVDVLELAAGTGIWTERLAARARSVLAIDAAPETWRLNEQRLGSLADKVEYERADLFNWRPPRRFDLVVACFWISHVPKPMLQGFFDLVTASLGPSGAFFVLDSRRSETSTAHDHVPDANAETMVRRLDDGREFTIVKNFWGESDLLERAARAGLELHATETPTFFIYATGHLAGQPAG